jgi:hypothetical protein
MPKTKKSEGEPFTPEGLRSGKQLQLRNCVNCNRPIEGKPLAVIIHRYGFDKARVAGVCNRKDCLKVLCERLQEWGWRFRNWNDK